MKAEFVRREKVRKASNSIHRLVLRRGIDGKDGSKAPRARRART